MVNTERNQEAAHRGTDCAQPKEVTMTNLSTYVDFYLPSGINSGSPSAAHADKAVAWVAIVNYEGDLTEDSGRPVFDHLRGLGFDAKLMRHGSVSVYETAEVPALLMLDRVKDALESFQG